MDFLNHFQLPVRYDVDTELLANFENTKENHISDHIQEWRHRTCLIKMPVPLAFLLEWFLKSLVPKLSKDVATSGVFLEEEVIMRAQQLELIYSQSGLLYEVLLKCRMYTMCNRQTQRPPSSLTEIRNNERRVRGIRNLPIMLSRETLKRRSQSIHVIFARKTI
jgi:hypothetical protein